MKPTFVITPIEAHKEEFMENKCQGLVFRGKKSVYYNQGRFVEKKEIRLLKKMSCRGCHKCISLMDDLKEEITNIGTEYGFPDIKDGGLYTLEFEVLGRDPEGGWVDDWSIRIAPFKNLRGATQK
jgi:hypothetical protein